MYSILVCLFVFDLILSIMIFVYAKGIESKTEFFITFTPFGMVFYIVCYLIYHFTKWFWKLPMIKGELF